MNKKQRDDMIRRADENAARRVRDAEKTLKKVGWSDAHERIEPPPPSIDRKGCGVG